MAETLLEIKKMCKNFGPIVALKDVDLTVRRGGGGGYGFRAERGQTIVPSGRR